MSIFSERKLSLNHWRYRLLHWCFNEENITCPAESALPQYLYCHYCPLFHLTNFIVLFSWLILTIKVIVWSCNGIGSGFSKIDWSFLKVLFRRKHVEEREPTDAELKKIQWSVFKEKTKEDIERGGLGNFLIFWSDYNHYFPLLDKDEVEIRFEKIKEEMIRAKIHRERMQNRIEYLIHLSRNLVKGLMYVACAGGVISVGWLVYSFHAPVIEFFGVVFVNIGDVFSWLLELELPELMPFLIYGIKILLATLFVLTIVVFVHRFKIVQKFVHVASVCVLTPLLFLTRMIGAPFMLLGKFFISVKRFIGEFYEDHCPPITIVDANGEAFEEVIT